MKYVTDTPRVGDRVREQCKMKNLMGNQNASVLYSAVMAWQHELVCLQTKDDTSNKKMLRFCTGNRNTDTYLCQGSSCH